MSEAVWLTARCERCSQNIEFESEHADETVQCPHCKADTTLRAQQAKPPPKRSGKVRYSLKSRGLESSLAAFATVFLLASCSVAALLAAAGLVAVTDEKLRYTGVALLAGGAFAAGSGFATSFAFKFLAESLSLLKKANGVGCSVAISEGSEKREFRCANCDKLVGESDSECAACGAKL